MEHQEKLDELFRRTQRRRSRRPADRTVRRRGRGPRLDRPNQPPRLGRDRLQRLQSSDLAISVHAASTGGGGRITSHRRPDRDLRQRRRSRHLLRGDRPAAGPEARDPERAEGREAQGHREQARPPPGTREPSRRPNPHAHAGEDRPPHPTHHEAEAPRATSRPRSPPPRRAPRTSRSSRPPTRHPSRRQPHHPPEEGSSSHDPSTRGHHGLPSRCRRHVACDSPRGPLHRARPATRTA